MKRKDKKNSISQADFESQLLSFKYIYSMFENAQCVHNSIENKQN